jgi:methanogenic corrinoid protein MtbC1
MPEPLLTRYLQPLLAGRRAECFTLINKALQDGAAAHGLLTEVVWPAMTQVDRLFREDIINTAAENMAARINRTVADMLQAHLPQAPPKGKRALIHCVEHGHEETGAQIIADLFAAQGWDSYLVGAGVPRDELLKLTGRLGPDVFVVYGTPPSAVPDVRSLITTIREIGVCATMQVIASGGVFNRADGLWQEVGADVFAENAPTLIELAESLPPRSPNVPRPTGLVKKRHRRRKGASLAAGAGAYEAPVVGAEAGFGCVPTGRA